MRDFMDYIQKAFYEASLWDVDNSYSSLIATSQGLTFKTCPFDTGLIAAG